MNKRELQNFSIWSKENLETQIKVSLNLLGIYGDNDIKNAYIQGDLTIIEGEEKTYARSFKASRDSIVRLVEDEGYDNVVEQFAYTWFNRLIALRFMEVHGYLDHGFKIFPDNGLIEPEILSNLNFVEDELNLDRNIYIPLKDSHDLEGLYRYVLFQQCKSLSKILPMLFSNEYSYLELLLPQVLLTGETVITKLVSLGEEDFKNDIEIIGWLYQFYISVKKDEVFSSKKKINKDTLPAVTQLFTPDWIVKYMAENSIGRIWLESYPNSGLINQMEYYVEEAEQTDEVNIELEKIRYKNVNPEEIKIIEPAAGSGHILVYAFELLMKMYEEQGYSRRDIPKLILENNLVGLDVDKRASQLAQFALMMKARSIDPRFFMDNRRTIPKVFEIKESKKLFHLDYKNSLIELINNDWKNNEYNLNDNDVKIIDYVVNQFEHGKVIGSLLKIRPSKAYLSIGNKINKLIKTTVGGVFTNEFVLYGLKRISELMRLSHFMSVKYDVMITNPPYIANSLLEDPAKQYVNKNYPNSKTDMFAMFMEVDFIIDNGFLGMINQHQWMFTKSYNELRKKIPNFNIILNMIHLGTRAFEEIKGEKVQSTSFILRRFSEIRYKSLIHRLVDYKSPNEKVKAFKNSNDTYTSTLENYQIIPWTPFAYWISDITRESFKHNKVSELGYVGRGLETSNQEKYERLWFEVDENKLSRESYSDDNRKKWYLFSRGGGYRRWYGNIINIVNWENEGKEMRDDRGIKGKKIPLLKNENKYFQQAITWSPIGTGNFGARIISKSIFGNGSALFLENQANYTIMLGLLNSKVVFEFLSFLSPALGFNAGDLDRIPVNNEIFSNKEINELVLECIEISKKDWDDREISINYRPFFKKRKSNLIQMEYNYYHSITSEYFNKVHINEIRLNDIFSEIYGFVNKNAKSTDEISILIEDEKHYIIRLVSYLIGVLMGRYSLVEDGLIYAGGTFDNTRYGNFELDSDGIIPLYPKLGMEDNLTNKIVILIKQIYGEDTYKENIDFIAETLGKRQTETSEEALNRYLYNDFYNVHIKTYQKRPIYWMLSSGKDNGFKALIYLHRYTEDMLAMVNTNYLLPETTRLRNELNDLEVNIKASEGVSRNRFEKEREVVNKQYHEATEYSLVLDHMANRYIKLDLDDGVKVNYMKFQNVEIVNNSGTKIKKDLLVPFKL